MKKGLFSICVVLLWLMGCTDIPKSPTVALYHWQSLGTKTAQDVQWVDTLGAEVIYLHLFDVDWDERQQQAIPVAGLYGDLSWLASRTVTPVLFLTNRSLKRLTTEEDRVQYVAKLYQHARTILAEMPASGIIRQWQIDCDWSTSTRATYFRILTLLRQRLRADDCSLSVTLRLHQLKYPAQTGVPPADRVTLMLYNMGEVQALSETNSILRLDLLEAYLDAPTYPLPMDIALPLFEWLVVYRYGELVHLLSEPELAVLRDTSRYEQRSDTRFRVRTTDYLEGVLLYPEDELRLEQVRIEQLHDALRLVRKYCHRPPGSVIYYHLHPAITRKYDAHALRDLPAKTWRR